MFIQIALVVDKNLFYVSVQLDNTEFILKTSLLINSEKSVKD